MKQRLKQTNNVMGELQKNVTNLFVIAMVGFFPLFYRNNYIDITDAKLSFFYICAGGLLVFTIVFAGGGWIKNSSKMIGGGTSYRII